MNSELMATETLLRKGPANMWRGIEADGAIHKFVVSKRNEWVGAIDDARIEYASAQPVGSADTGFPHS